MNYENRAKSEARIQAAVQDVFNRYLPIAQGNRLGGAIIVDLERDLIGTLRGELTETYLDAARQIGQKVGNFGTDDLVGTAQAWAARQAAMLGRDFSEMVEGRLSVALVNGESLADASAKLFTESRALAIGITETTRAATVGMDHVATAVIALSEQVVTWHAKGGNACEICRPYDGRPRSVWGIDFPEGPPAHPNCQCYLLYGGIPA